jgi:hypothetical protein
VSPLILSFGLFCVWPVALLVIGYIAGKRRLKIRSPFYSGQVQEPDEHDEFDTDAQPVIRKESAIKRLTHRDVGFGK